MSWTPDIEQPANYKTYTNGSDITFYIPEQEALADVPYSFEVFAASIDKNQIIDEEGRFLMVDGSRAMTGDFDAGSKNIVNANDVDATTATVSGQATMGSAVVQNEAVDDVKTVRNITTSLNEPPVDGGVDGDIWIQYEVE